jgi:hypothetical protein
MELAFMFITPTGCNKHKNIIIFYNMNVYLSNVLIISTPFTVFNDI